MDTDSAGNIVAYNRGPETIRLFNPGGTTVITTLAPSSQLFDVVEQGTSVGNWSAYFE